jgi:hypothetical protein
MKLLLQVAVLIVLAAAAVLAAENRSGYLVDYRCYQIASGNVGAGSTHADTHMDSHVRQCPPNGKTKSFGLVQFDWKVYELTSAGDAKAAELVRNAGKQRMYVVNTIGSIEAGLLNVDSVAIAKKSGSN